MKKAIFLTGRPGIGKTTVLLKTIEELKKLKIKIGGMISREVREQGKRIGFEIIDLSLNKKGWLAHVNQPEGPRIGKYRVNLQDLNSIGVEAILNAVEKAEAIIIDEIGPMELFSKNFKEAVLKALESQKLVIGTIHYRAKNQIINQIKRREDSEIIEVTLENRENLHKLIMEKISKYLKEKN